MQEGLRKRFLLLVSACWLRRGSEQKILRSWFSRRLSGPPDTVFSQRALLLQVNSSIRNFQRAKPRSSPFNGYGVVDPLRFHAEPQTNFTHKRCCIERPAVLAAVNTSWLVLLEHYKDFGELAFERGTSSWVVKSPLGLLRGGLFFHVCPINLN